MCYVFSIDVVLLGNNLLLKSDRRAVRLETRVATATKSVISQMKVCCCPLCKHANLPFGRPSIQPASNPPKGQS